MVESCRRWAAENDPEHAGEYPLPLDDERRALLALRVRSSRSTLDLFGLVGYKPRTVVVPEVMPPGIRYEQTDNNPALGNPDDYLWVGSLACVLSARDDMSLLHVMLQAQRWWAHISIEKIWGRPSGSSTHASRDEFVAALAAAKKETRAAGKKITQLEIERQLGVRQGDGRQLRKWLKQYEMSWSEAKKL